MDSRKQEINSILDTYLDDRNNPRFSFKNYIQKRKRQKELEKENKDLETKKKQPETMPEISQTPEYSVNYSEIETEIQKEKRPGLFSRIFRRSKKKEIEEEPPQLTAEDYSYDYSEAIIEEEPRKPGFFARVFMRKKKEEEIPVEEPVIPDLGVSEEKSKEIVDDMIQLGKATTTILQTLPPDQIRNVKNMPEFEIFKGILQKHEIIK